MYTEQNITTEPYITQAHIKKGEQFSISANGSVSRGCDPESFIAIPKGGSCDNKSDFLYPQFRCWSLVVKIGDGEPFEYNNTTDWQKANDGGTVKLVMNYNKTILEKAVNSNCTGIANGWNIQIQTDDKNDYKFADYPQVGDVVIYWGNDGGLRHSGYVNTVDDCIVTGINTLLQQGENGNNDKELINVNPDTPALTKRFGNWTVYHTNRPNQRKITEVEIDSKLLPVYPIQVNPPNKVTEGITDRNIYIYFPQRYIHWDLLKGGTNCHGYTFDCTNENDNSFYQITGYGVKAKGYGEKNGDIVWYIDNIGDQITAVKYILRDNGYTQIHAIGIDGKEHYNPAYNISTFNLPY